MRRARDPAQLRLGGVGALVAWKGLHHILDALARLPSETRARVRFEHIGAAGNDAASQRYAADLRARTTALGLDGCVAWRGEQATSAEFLRGIDALVVASDHEPFSIAVLEALAAGVPVLAADTGGAQDLIEPGRSGWFFRSGDPAALAAAIARLAGEEAWARIAVGPESVRQFTAPVIAARWAEVYAAVAGAEPA
jgi:glycosyltransferase involved in cell wall biosynthesis